jgi:hypothetical protein
MTAEPCDLSAFIFELGDEVDRVTEIHPAARAGIMDLFTEMIDNIDDVHRVVHLMGLVRVKIAQELRWRADDIESGGRLTGPTDLEHVEDLRRCADQIEATS